MVMLVEDEATGQKAEECTFEPYEVYAVDVAFSTGEGINLEESLYVVP